MKVFCGLMGMLSILVGIFNLGEPLIGVPFIADGILLLVVVAILDNQEQTIHAIEDNADPVDRFAHRYAFKVFNKFLESSYPEDAEIVVDEKNRRLRLNDSGNYSVSALVSVKTGGSKQTKSVSAEIAPEPGSNIRTIDSWKVVSSNLDV